MAAFELDGRDCDAGIGQPLQVAIDGGQPDPDAAISQLQALTDDRETAYSALFERFVESNQTPVSTKLVLEAEQAVIRQGFDGSRSAYVAALRAAPRISIRWPVFARSSAGLQACPP